MTLREFLQAIRYAHEPHVVINEDGDTEYVVVPYERYVDLLAGQQRTAASSSSTPPPSLTEKAVHTVHDAVGEESHAPAPREANQRWDAMMEEVDPEPRFQFEPVDEEEELDAAS